MTDWQRIDTREAIYWALHHAIQWNGTLIEANTPDYGERPADQQTVVDRAMAENAAFRRILKRRYGSGKSRLDAMLENAKMVSIYDMRGDDPA